MANQPGPCSFDDPSCRGHVQLVGMGPIDHFGGYAMNADGRFEQPLIPRLENALDRHIDLGRASAEQVSPPVLSLVDAASTTTVATRPRMSTIPTHLPPALLLPAPYSRAEAVIVDALRTLRTSMIPSNRSWSSPSSISTDCRNRLTDLCHVASVPQVVARSSSAGSRPPQSVTRVPWRPHRRSR